MLLRSILTLLFLCPPVTVAAAAPDPYESVKLTTDKLLARLVEVQPLYTTDPEKFYQEIQGSLEPFIDFDGFARGVMAKYYRRATDEQKEKFVATFQRELIQTYSKALVEFDNQKVEVQPLSTPVEDDRATIELKIHAGDGKIYPVVYTLALVEGIWKLRNVVIDGINIGLQFRSQFSNYMEKYNNDIDKVIAHWNVNV